MFFLRATFVITNSKKTNAVVINRHVCNNKS
jgi:hypothetical protein